MKNAQRTLRAGHRLLIICVSLIAFLLPAISIAEDSGDHGEANLPAGFSKFSSATFQQIRHVPALERPLTSSGSIEITPSGFIWAQQLPFENTLVFDGESIIETTRIGDREISRPLQDPITTNITRTLYGMMTGTWDDIRGAFRILNDADEAGAETSFGWTRQLVPRNSEIHELIPAITLSGNQFLERIVVGQKEGTSTVIELSDHQTVQ